MDLGVVAGHDHLGALGQRDDAGDVGGAEVELGAVALLIALVGDVPDLDETGFIGQVYEDAAAGAKAGFYLETLGGVLLLVSGVLMLAVPSAASAPAPRVRERERPADAEA